MGGSWGRVGGRMMKKRRKRVKEGLFFGGGWYWFGLGRMRKRDDCGDVWIKVWWVSRRSVCGCGKVS